MNSKTKVILALSVLVLASLACQTIMGGAPKIPTVPPIDSGGPNFPGGTDSGGSGGGGGSSVADLPKPSDAENVVNLGNDTVTFQTKLSLKDVVAFYRDEFGKLGYKEDSLLTVTSDTTFSIVFTGHESGKKIVVQGVDFSGSSTVTVSLQDF